jgi:hypothetical protein
MAFRLDLVFLLTIDTIILLFLISKILKTKKPSMTEYSPQGCFAAGEATFLSWHSADAAESPAFPSTTTDTFISTLNPFTIASSLIISLPRT